ncbi:hypothetical protein CANCADRAFT_27333 [Tortispora caseinolytica NRRL Y-17796]|uniref:tRNA-dihydrouridine synthase n=1 Tax=Tortispora caseinolytica NRRL Y-17796 TaxID=767744 RepID=A0A1E4TC28_9ASCO|nr:hypothetical protein CANCADRAFT_27333 [Tortispora caseinolytica NRRL Y-17796]
MTRTKIDPRTIFSDAKTEGRLVYIAGPMVRYSKLPFRATVRHFGADIVYTPMILAREFIRSQYARDTDFTTNDSDSCLIVQFGVNSPEDLARAAEMVEPYCDGIGINCGCPIKDQISQGIGAALMEQPEKVCAMIRAVKERCPNLCVEAKIRIHRDINKTLRMAESIVNAGADYLVVHGRCKEQRSREPVNIDAIKAVCQHVRAMSNAIPVVANGDVFSVEDAARIAQATGCDGLMAARGILENPSLFSGANKATWGSVELILHYSSAYGLPFRLVQHHVSEMLTHSITRAERKSMNETSNLQELLDWLDERFVLLRPYEKGFGEAIDLPRKCDLNVSTSS